MFSRVCHHCARLTRPWVPVPVISHPILTSDSVAAFFTCYGVGMVLLTLLRFFLDKLIIPGNRSVDIEISEDQNWWVWRGAARPHFVASSVLLLLCLQGCGCHRSRYCTRNCVCSGLFGA